MKQIIWNVIHAFILALTWIVVKIATIFVFLFKLVFKFYSWIKTNFLKLLHLIFNFLKKVCNWIFNLPKLIKKYYYKSLHWLNWKKKILHLRYYPAILSAGHMIKSIVLNCIWLFSFGLIIQKAKLCSIENDMLLFSDKVGPITIENALSILGTQISVTLVCLSIISLIANSEKKHIMGERATDLAFPAKGFFSFKAILTVIFMLLFSNLLLILIEKPIGLILLIFISSTYLTAYTIYRYAIVLLGQRSQKNKLFAQYYRENIKHIKKYKPIENHIQPKMFRYKNVVLSQIANKELDSYKDNIEYHFSILSHIFFNHKKKTQNYYTEMGCSFDIAGHITSFISKLLNEGQHRESIDYLYRLLSQYNYYRIINVENYELLFLPEDHIQIAKTISTESELEDYVSRVLKIIDFVHYQTYLFTIEDLSYCRVAEVGIHFLTSNQSYEKLYCAIKENPHLQDYEKSRIYELIFDHIRTTEHHERFPRTNVDDLLANRTHHPEKEMFPYEIKGEPVANLFLSFLERHDYDNMYYFSQMNIPTALKQFVFTLISLSVINITYLDNRRIYYSDINIEIEESKKAIQHSKMCTFSINATAFKSLYKFVIEHYTAMDNDPNSYVDGSIYSFTPRFRFLKKVVDTFFHELATDNNLQDCFLEENSTYQSDQTLSELVCAFKDNGNSSIAQTDNT